MGLWEEKMDNETLKFTKPIQSPCRKLCKLNEDFTACLECKRTTEEIQDWSKYTDQERKDIMIQLRSR